MRAKLDVSGIILLLFNFLVDSKYMDLKPVYVARDIFMIPFLNIEDGDIRAIMKKLDKIEQASLDLRKSVNEKLRTAVNTGSRPREVTDLPVDSVQGTTSITSVSNFFENLHTLPVAHLTDASMTSDDDEVGYATAMSRRALKRMRKQSHETSPTNHLQLDQGHPILAQSRSQPSYSEMTVSGKAQTQVRNELPRIMGSSKSIGGIKAAKDITKKIVFCVSNVAVSCSKEDLAQFISGMGVEVKSCESAKFLGSFRVCINARDVAVFCQPENWPEYVTLRLWVFKPKLPIMPSNPNLHHSTENIETASSQSHETSNDISSDTTLINSIHSHGSGGSVPIPSINNGGQTIK